jgi:hypothetical protein
MRCQWSEYGVGCHEIAEYLLVYGCLDQHIAERLYCYTHCSEWASLFEAKQIPCFQLGCTLKGVQWDYLDVDKIRRLDRIKAI